MQESRQHIKDRMLKNAARAWGLSEKEPESNFDPLLSMLLSACSIELEKISGEIHSSRSRILQRLVQLLSPEAFTGALPAHAVATAKSVEHAQQVNTDDQFYFPKRMTAQTENADPVWKDIFFSPTAPLPLKNASIQFVATGTSLYKINNDVNKEIF